MVVNTAQAFFFNFLKNTIWMQKYEYFLNAVNIKCSWFFVCHWHCQKGAHCTSKIIFGPHPTWFYHFSTRVGYSSIQLILFCGENHKVKFDDWGREREGERNNRAFNSLCKVHLSPSVKCNYNKCIICVIQPIAAMSFTLIPRRL